MHEEVRGVGGAVWSFSGTVAGVWRVVGLKDDPDGALGVGVLKAIGAFTIERWSAKSMRLGMEASYGASKRSPCNPPRFPPSRSPAGRKSPEAPSHSWA